MASLSLDLDNEWSYIKTHGDPAWRTFPSYLDVVVPRFLSMLDRLGLRITVFVVGQDAVLPENRAALRSIAASGHEIGNHSFHHEPWLHRYSPEQLDAEIVTAGDAIEAATGVRPCGFRGPGFSLSRPTLDALANHGYRYDCSTLPTYIGPLARAYYFASTKLSAQEKAERRDLFGSLGDGLRPIRQYEWELDGRSLVELPVTTFPLLKIPIHFSYVLYIGSVLPALALPYFRSALLACRALGVAPSLLLHPLDFLDASDVASLGFFPAMQMPKERKLGLLERALRAYAELFDIVPTGAHAGAVAAAAPRRIVPRLRS